MWKSEHALNRQPVPLIQSTIPMISGDFLTRWNAITVGKGRGSEGKKGQFWGISYFWIEVFFKEVLGLTPNISSQGETIYVNIIAVRKYNFLDSFLFCFVYKIFAVTIRNIIP